jgi:type III secretion protein F
MANNVDTLINGLGQTPGAGAPAFPIQNYNTIDGFDLIWSQKFLQDSMTKVENDISQIQQNANLSDTEKMFSMQMAMNTWSAISNLRTNILKSVSDTLKSIARNVA